MLSVVNEGTWIQVEEKLVGEGCRCRVKMWGCGLEGWLTFVLSTPLQGPCTWVSPSP